MTGVEARVEALPLVDFEEDPEIIKEDSKMEEDLKEDAKPMEESMVLPRDPTYGISLVATSDLYFVYLSHMVGR